MGTEMKIGSTETPLTRRYGTSTRSQQPSFSKAKAQTLRYNLRARRNSAHVNTTGGKSPMLRRTTNRKLSKRSGRMPRHKSCPERKNNLESSAKTSRKLSDIPVQNPDKTGEYLRQPQNSTLQDELEVGGLYLQDFITCGHCSKIFPLADIYAFIQHKARSHQTMAQTDQCVEDSLGCTKTPVRLQVADPKPSLYCTLCKLSPKSPNSLLYHLQNIHKVRLC